jgi:hypothetical protein
MEVAMIQVNVMEDREAIIVRFLNGLNLDIANKMKLHHYVELKDIMHMAMNVKQQLKRKEIV